MAAPIVIVICGVSGVGKSTTGRLLAARLGWAFHDADDYHPAANVDKMRRGEPLTDADRGPWLDMLAALITEAVDRHTPMVLACSALKAGYRTRLGIDQRTVISVWLEGSQALIAARLADRDHAFMPATLLDSQFAAAEPPDAGLRLEVDIGPEQLIEQIVHAAGVEAAL